MASVPSSHLVLFIAAIVVSAGLAGVLVQGAQEYGDSLRESQSEFAKDVATEIEVINDPDSPNATYDATNDTLTLYVKNVGARTIPNGTAEVLVLVNGTHYRPDATAVADGSAWRPGNVLEVTVSVALPSGEQTRVVVVVSGGRDRFGFTTP